MLVVIHDKETRVVCNDGWLGFNDISINITIKPNHAF